jgi:hypothetical protein
MESPKRSICSDRDKFECLNRTRFDVAGMTWGLAIFFQHGLSAGRDEKKVIARKLPHRAGVEICNTGRATTSRCGVTPVT